MSLASPHAFRSCEASARSSGCMSVRTLCARTLVAIRLPTDTLSSSTHS